MRYACTICGTVNIIRRNEVNIKVDYAGKLLCRKCCKRVNYSFKKAAGRIIPKGRCKKCSDFLHCSAQFISKAKHWLDNEVKGQ